LKPDLEQKPSFKGIGRVVYQVSRGQEDAIKNFQGYPVFLF